MTKFTFTSIALASLIAASGAANAAYEGYSSSYTAPQSPAVSQVATITLEGVAVNSNSNVDGLWDAFSMARDAVSYMDDARRANAPIQLLLKLQADADAAVKAALTAAKTANITGASGALTGATNKAVAAPKELIQQAYGIASNIEVSASHVGFMTAEDLAHLFVNNPRFLAGKTFLTIEGGKAVYKTYSAGLTEELVDFINDEVTVAGKWGITQKTTLVNSVEGKAVVDEPTRAKGEEQRIEGKVDAEVTRAMAAEAALSERMSTVEGDLGDIRYVIKGIEGVNKVQDEAIAANTAAIATVDARVTTEVTRLDGRITTLDTKVDNAIAYQHGVNQQVQGQIAETNAKVANNTKRIDNIEKVGVAIAINTIVNDALPQEVKDAGISLSASTGGINVVKQLEGGAHLSVGANGVSLGASKDLNDNVRVHGGVGTEGASVGLYVHEKGNGVGISTSGPSVMINNHAIPLTPQGFVVSAITGAYKSVTGKTAKEINELKAANAAKDEKIAQLQATTAMQAEALAQLQAQVAAIVAAQAK